MRIVLILILILTIIECMRLRVFGSERASELMLQLRFERVGANNS